VAGTLAIPVLRPVSSLPAYTCARNPLPAFAVARRIHPTRPGKFKASRAMRRPQRSSSGPESKQPTSVPIVTRLAATRKLVRVYLRNKNDVHAM